uniref:Uncharacterized protein n=1 Tax=viral metagenome TaxID=1070528 RepID=A0A6C0EGQ2_9ZZZZ
MSSVPEPLTICGLLEMVKRPTTDAVIALVNKAISSKMSPKGFSNADVANLKSKLGFDPDKVSIGISGNIFKVVLKGQQSGSILRLDVSDTGPTWASVSAPVPASVSIYALCGMAKHPPNGDPLVKKAFSTRMKLGDFTDEEVGNLKRAFGFDPATVSMGLRGEIFLVVPKGQKSGPVLELDIKNPGPSWASIPWG